jgi:hypothetical protein
VNVSANPVTGTTTPEPAPGGVSQIAAAPLIGTKSVTKSSAPTLEVLGAALLGLALVLLVVGADLRKRPRGDNPDAGRAEQLTLL